ncbi:hypothetical protein LMG1860_06269 [Achromobacter denitrificans]|nr:hypothetical protein LMG1860_06269 [Achromobacter denitrificans]
MVHPPRRTGADQFAVELAVALLPFFEAGVGVGGQALLGLAEAMEGGEHGAFPVVVADGDGLAQGLGFEQHAVFGDVAEIFQRDGRDVEAALAVGDDERIGHEQGEGFAQRAGAHAVVVLQVFDPQARAGRKPALDDVAAQADVGRAHQGVGGGGMGERGEGGAV